MIITGQVGPQATNTSLPNTAQPIARMGNMGDLIVSELHGRYYEAAYRGTVYMGGMGLTAINNATFTSATTGVTATPIVGVWNPSTSKYNLVIMQVILGVTITAATNTGGAPFVWLSSAGNTAISTGANPYNRSTFVSGASQAGAKDMSGAALTGLTTTLAIRGAAGLGGGSSAAFSFVGTAVGQATTQGVSVDNVDGSIIVPPGGVLGLFATTTPVAHSAASSIVWAEVPL